MSFVATALVNDQYLVQGSDEGDIWDETILDGQQWNQIKQHQKFKDAVGEVDAAIEAFLAPIIDATAKFAEAQRATPDPLEFVVLAEPTEGIEEKQGEIIRLNAHSMILRAIEEGHDTRLRWANGTLCLLAWAPTGQQP